MARIRYCTRCGHTESRHSLARILLGETTQCTAARKKGGRCECPRFVQPSKAHILLGRMKAAGMRSTPQLLDEVTRDGTGRALLATVLRYPAKQEGKVLA